MPPINHLNPPPNPFWDFVADMQDHPLFAAYGPPQNAHQGSREEPAAPAATGPASNVENKEKANVEDPPEIDPATLGQNREQAQNTREHPCRGRRRCGSGSDNDGERRRDWCGRRGGGRGGRHGFQGLWGQPGFPFAGLGGGPFWTRDAHPPPPPPGGFGPGPHGPGPHRRGGFHHRGGPPHHHHGPPHHPHGPRGPSPPGRSPPGFDLGQFLNDLGQRIGVDLSGAAGNLGLDRFMPSSGNPEVDFEPKVDIFDRQTDFIVHLSLPGAKKSDVGVDWDGEHSSLHVAGVVHRPEVDETMLNQLVVDGRKRETGVFDKVIRLGTRRDPAVIDVAGIKAKMTDGVLIVTVPKTQRLPEKREVPIAKSQTPSPARDEKEVRFHLDHDMADAEPEREIQLVDLSRTEKTEASKGKQAEYEEERNTRESTGTVEAFSEPEQREQLPAYHPVEHQDGSDWEHFGSDEEGEYIKINVD